jgi:Brp/Blh family beta-carotene 15,15'-monooxygenase
MTGRDPEAWPLLANHTTRWATAIVLQHAVVLAVAMSRRARSVTLRREGVAAVVLTALFVATPPLIGFAVYFGLWHSLNHLYVLRDVLARPPVVERMPLSELVRLAAPRSAIALVGLASLSAAAVATEQLDLAVPLALVLVSVLTLPHMVVVERLWRVRRA